MADVQIAIIDQQNTQIALAAPPDTQVTAAVPGVQGPKGEGVPTGGTANQVLFKQSSTNYDTAWGAITSAMIGDLQIVDGDVSTTAAIAGTKISPNFGAQNVVTTGTSTAASFIPTSSTVPTNGLYLPAANSVALSTNGTGRLFVDASGNVGLGITPVANTLLGGARGSSLPGLIELAGNGNTVGSSGFAIGQDGSGVATLFQRANAAMYFATNGSERLRITSAGLVGIGASSPSVRLQVQDSIAGGSDGTVATLHNFSDTGGDTRYVGLNFRIGSDNGTSAIRAYRTNSASNYETNLSFWTNPAGATQTPLQAMTIDSYQRVGIGTTSPGATLHLNGGGGKIRFGTHPNFYSEISHDTSVNANTIYNNNDSAGHQFMRNGTTELARIDSSGRLLVGTSSATNNLRLNETLGIVSAGSNNYGGLSVTTYAGTSIEGGSIIDLQRSRGTTDGSLTKVIADDRLGVIVFRGSDGAAFSDAALIEGRADGEWNTAGDTTDSPGRLVFSTTADGASSPTERLRITSTGQVRLAGAGITFNGDTATANELDDYEEGTWTPSLGGTWTANPADLSGKYVKIGRAVYVAIYFAGGAKSTSTSGYFTGLPFLTNDPGTGQCVDSNVTDCGGALFSNNDRLWISGTSFAGFTQVTGVYFT